MELIVLLILLSVAFYSAIAVFRWMLEIIISLCNWLLGRPNYDYYDDAYKTNNKTFQMTINYIAVFGIGYYILVEL